MSTATPPRPPPSIASGKNVTALEQRWDDAFAGQRYKKAMRDVVHFHGTYRYATREHLEHAISSVRAVLDAGSAGERRAPGDVTGGIPGDVPWMRCFVTRGTVLTVNLTSRVDRARAAAVLGTLAQTAVEGAFEARLDDARSELLGAGDLG